AALAGGRGVHAERDRPRARGPAAGAQRDAVVLGGPGGGPQGHGVAAAGPGALVAHVPRIDHAVAVGVAGRCTGKPVAVGIEVAAHGDRVDTVGVDVTAHRRAALRARVGEVAHGQAVGGGGEVVGAERIAARAAGEVGA